MNRNRFGLMMLPGLTFLTLACPAQPVVTVHSSSVAFAWAGDAGGPQQNLTSNANPFSQTANASVDNTNVPGTPAVQTATMSLSLTGQPFHIFGSSSGVTTITTLNSSGPFANAHSSFDLLIHLDQVYYYQWSASVTAAGAANSTVTLYDDLGFPNVSFQDSIVNPVTGTTISRAESGRFGLTGLAGNLQLIGSTGIGSGSVGSASFTFDLLLSATPIPEPSTYAALNGLAALGLALLKRRRERRE